MPQQSKTQMLADRATVLAQYNATTDANRKRIYKNTIDEIDRRLAALQQPQQRQAPAPQTAPQPGTPTRPPAPPRPVVTPVPAPSQNQAAPHLPQQITLDLDMPTPTVEMALAPGGAMTVVLKWADAREDETLTEGEARQRFATSLRDAADLRAAELGRWDHLPRFASYIRAVGYYKALCIFWGRQPGAVELQVYNMSRTKAYIFQLIQSETQQ